MEKGFIVFDPSRCMGCKSCEIACAVEHSLSKNLYSAIMEYPRPKPRIRVFQVDNVKLPLTCRHCEEPPCVQVCPTGAMYRTEEGIVLNRPEKCIRCRLCVLVCPIAHPYVDPETRTLVKCDLCIHRLRQGKMPACVEACPTGALMYVTERELAGERARMISDVMVRMLEEFKKFRMGST